MSMGLGGNSCLEVLELKLRKEVIQKTAWKWNQSVVQQIPSNLYVSKDYFSSKYCHCNNKLFIVM